MFFAAPAYAQHFDLTEMPTGYTFTLNEHDGHTTITHIGSEDGLLLFSKISNDGISPAETLIRMVNSSNQIVRFHSMFVSAVATPHDCWLQIGPCESTVVSSNGINLQVTSETYVSQGIWFQTYFVEGDQGRLFNYRGCYTIDEYGFPIASYDIYENGDIQWSTRETTQGVSDARADFEALKAVCENPDEFTS